MIPGEYKPNDLQAQGNALFVRSSISRSILPPDVDRGVARQARGLTSAFKAIARCLEEMPEFNSIIDYRNTSVFEDVDISIPVEVEVERGGGP